MPTYEYECNLCHHRFDVRQGFNDKPASICPRCKGEARRVFHAVPVMFKGSGFYCTDHGRGMAGTDRKTEDKSEKQPASKEGDGSKPAEANKKPDAGVSKASSQSEPQSVAA